MPTLAMRAARRRSIEANLFPYALPAVEPWAAFRWHAGVGESCDTWKEHSSQALAIDVFGTFKVHPRRDRPLDALAASLGLPTGGPWEVALEWHDPDNLLREKTPTFVDAVARSPRALIFFECKFSESDGGACSQTRPIAAGRHRGLRQCSGYYSPQVNPVNQREARCALTAKGIAYWDVIPTVFGYPAAASIAPCPFAGPWFQWMRNLTTCYAVARHLHLRSAFVLAYAEGPGLPMSQRVHQPDWQWLLNRVDPAAVVIQALALQSLLRLAAESDPLEPVWTELSAWVTRKIDSVCGRSMAPRPDA
jgi:hypothetical protein